MLVTCSTQQRVRCPQVQCEPVRWGTTRTASVLGVLGEIARRDVEIARRSNAMGCHGGLQHTSIWISTRFFVWVSQLVLTSQPGRRRPVRVSECTCANVACGHRTGRTFESARDDGPVTLWQSAVTTLVSWHPDAVAVAARSRG